MPGSPDPANLEEIIQDAEQPTMYSLNIKIPGLEEFETKFANVAFVNFDEAVFQVVFAELLNPIVTGPDDAKELAARGQINAKPVARLVCTPTMMRQLMDLVQRQLQLFEDQLQPDFGSSPSGQ